MDDGASEPSLIIRAYRSPTTRVRANCVPRKPIAPFRREIHSWGRAFLVPAFQSRAAGDEQGRESREHEMGIGSGSVDPALLDADQQTGSGEQSAAHYAPDGTGAGDRQPDDGGRDGEEYPQDGQHARETCDTECSVPLGWGASLWRGAVAAHVALTASNCPSGSTASV